MVNWAVLARCGPGAARLAGRYRAPPPLRRFKVFASTGTRGPLATPNLVSNR